MGAESEQPDCDLVFSNITPESLPREASCVLCSSCRLAPANWSPPRPVIRLLLLSCAVLGPVFYFSLSFCWHVVHKCCTDSVTLHSALVARLCQEWTRSFSNAPLMRLVCIYSVSSHSSYPTSYLVCPSLVSSNKEAKQILLQQQRWKRRGGIRRWPVFVGGCFRLCLRPSLHSRCCQQQRWIGAAP